MPTPSALCVLVVDADPDAAQATAELLRADGHRVRASSSAVEAVGASSADRPDVILVDSSLPDLDGFGVARWLRVQAPDAVLVAVIEHPGHAVAEACRAAGFDRLLATPLTAGILRDLLRAVGDRQSSA